MKVLIDASGATERSGGMRLHAVEIVRTWSEVYPEDELLVLGGAHLSADLPNVRVFSWSTEGIVRRAFGQLILSGLIARKQSVDFILSLSPIVSLSYPISRLACFEHDWRHIRNPEEFPLIQRLYRKLWVISARRAGLVFGISPKAIAETRAYAGRDDVVYAPNGRDHARRWSAAACERSGDIAVDPYVVTFGHHNNKRPEIAIEAFAYIEGNAKLVVLGARGVYGNALEALAESVGVRERVSFPGFVSNDKYQQLITNASAVMLLSSDEGFGLPLAEAEFLGVPALVAEDSGVAELFGNAVAVKAEPRSVALALARVLDAPAGSRESGTRIATGTWQATVKIVRSSIANRLAKAMA